MERTYRGYEIKAFATLGDNRGLFYEAWKDGKLMAFAYDEVSIEMIIDSFAA